MERHNFKTKFNIKNLPISIGDRVIIEDEESNERINAKVIGGLMNKDTNKIDRIGLTLVEEDNEWDNIMIVPKDNVLWVISEDGEREWKRIDGGKFMKQETNNVRRVYVRTTRNSNRKDDNEDEDEIVITNVTHPQLK